MFKMNFLTEWFLYVPSFPVTTKVFGMSHMIGCENDTQTIDTIDPSLQTIELCADKIQWN